MHPYLGAWIEWLLLAHVLSAFGFVLLHGPSVFAMWMLRSERELAKVQALLMLSRRSSELSWAAWVPLGITGILLTLAEHTWKLAWVWGSAVVLVGITLAMSAAAARPFNMARGAAGLPWFDGKGVRPAGPVVRADLDAALLTIRARAPAIMLIGILGIVALVWLMVRRPTF